MWWMFCWIPLVVNLAVNWARFSKKENVEKKWPLFFTTNEDYREYDMIAFFILVISLVEKAKD